MTTGKYDELFERSKSGEITSEELAEVAAELQKPNSRWDIMTLINISSNTPEDLWNASLASVLEPFLDGPDDILAEEALLVLFGFWGSNDRYIPQIIKFMDGVSWDSRGHLGPVSIFLAWRYLRHVSNPELLGKLIQIFENATDEKLRKLAYLSLYELYKGRGWRPASYPPKLGLTLFDGSRLFDLNTMVDARVVQAAKERLIREEKDSRDN